MSADHAAAPDLLKRGSLGGRAVVAEIGDSERRRVLETSVRAEPPVGSERIVGAVYRRRNREWRELLISTERFERWLVADAVVDAEVHVARVDFAYLEAIIDAGRRSLSDLPRESGARSVTAIDVDARCAAPVREDAQSQLVVRRAEPRLSEIDARVVSRNEVPREGAGLGHGSVVEDAAPVERAGEKVSNGGLKIESPRATQEVVVSEPSLELDEIDCVESSGETRLPRRRLLHGDDADLRRIRCRDVDRRSRLDRLSPGEDPVLERPLALEQSWSVGIGHHRESVPIV